MYNRLIFKIMLSEVNNELFTLCEDAANEIVGRIIGALDACFAKMPVPSSLVETDQNYTDFLARRIKYSCLENVGTVQQRALAFVKTQLGGVSTAERFALAAYVIEMNEQMPEDEDDDAPEANQVDNHMPTDDELADYIVGFWSDMLYDREYEGYDEKADITVTPMKLGGKCPYCGGKLLPIVYGEPGPELFEKADRGEVILGGCIVSGFDPQKECSECGFQFLEVDEKEFKD